MIFRFTTRVREIVRVLRGLPPDEAVRQRTMAINAQLAKGFALIKKWVKLREARLAQEKLREEAALQEVHMIVTQMAQLKESLAAAEKAAVEFVDQIGDEAKAQLEDEWNKKAETLMTTVVKTQENFGADFPAVPQGSRSGTK